MQTEDDIKNAKNITFLEVNAGPDATPLHIYDTKFKKKERRKIHYRLLIEALNIARKNKGKAMNFFKYISFLAQEELPLLKLKKKIKKLERKTRVRENPAAKG